MLTKLIAFNQNKLDFFSKIATKPLSYFYLALFAYLCMAWFDEGYLQADEHFQILEMATYKQHANLSGIPWEFDKEIRPTIQIWYVLSLIKLSSFIVSNFSPFIINFLCKALASVLSAISCYVFYLSFHSELNTPERKNWFLLFTAFNFITFTHAAHFSSEVISANFFIIGLSLLFNPNSKVKGIRYLYVGLLFGLAIISRYQAGIMVLSLIAWQILLQKNTHKNLVWMLSGICLILFSGMLLDSLFYGHFVCTAWRYFYFNLIENYAAKFGTSHWTYFSTFYALPFGPLYVLGTFYFIYKKPTHVLTWIILPFLVIHQLIGHKEARFLFPIMGFIPFILMQAAQSLPNDMRHKIWNQNRIPKWLPSIWYFNSIPILFYILSHYHLYDMYHHFWENYQNQPVILYRYSTADNPLHFGWPLQYYLPNTMHIKNYSKIESSTPDQPLQLMLLTCNQELPTQQKAKLLYDDCPSGLLGNLYHHFKWTKRSQIFRHQGQVYQI